MEYKVDKLEDLVLKLYDELDHKIKDVFEQQNYRFKQHNHIIKNIFKGFSQEIGAIKTEINTNSQKWNSEYTCSQKWDEENGYEDGSLKQEINVLSSDDPSYKTIN